MPRGDGTGPTGQGPRSGGGFGYCNNRQPQGQGRGQGRRTENTLNQIQNLGGPNNQRQQLNGRRGGFFRGMRNCFSRFWGMPKNINMTPDDERTYLNNLKKDLETEKESIEKRLNEIKSDKQD